MPKRTILMMKEETAEGICGQLRKNRVIEKGICDGSVRENRKIWSKSGRNLE